VAGGNQNYSVGPGMAADSSNTLLFSRTTSLAKTMAAWVQGAGGSLDTGAVAASTWYHSYEIYNPTTLVADHLTSLQPTNANPSGTPTLPSGFTRYRRVGAMKTDGLSNLIAENQHGKLFQWGTPTVDSTVFANPQTVNVPPGISVLWHGRCYGVASNTAGWGIDWLSPAQTAPGSNGFALTNAGGASASSQAAGGTMEVLTNAQQQLQYVQVGTVTSGDLLTYGWIDARGQDQ
jgi:hypothetical protein